MSETIVVLASLLGFVTFCLLIMLCAYNTALKESQELEKKYYNQYEEYQNLKNKYKELELVRQKIISTALGIKEDE